MNAPMLRGLACLAFCAPLAGCIPPIYVDRQDYPAAWPPQALVEEGCPELSGRYHNQGEGRFPTALARQVLRDTADPLKLVQQVAFDGPHEGELGVRLYDAQGAVLVEQRWQEGRDYRCEDGWLTRRHGHFWATPVLTGADSERFSRSQDGALLVQNTTEAGGVFLVIPVYRGERFWFRYPAVGQAPR